MSSTSSAGAPRSAGARLRRSRAARAPLPAAVVLLAALGACAIVLPLVGMGTRVAWPQLPQLLASPSAQQALWLSVRTCLAATVISVALGVPLALLLARSWPGVRIARILAVLPMTMPPVVAGIALLSTLGRRGLLGAHLEAWGMTIAFSTTAVIIAQVFVAMPYLVVTLEAALRSRDTRSEDIARTLGAGPWRVLLRITLPLVAPALARGTALALGRALGEFGATIAFAGSRQGVTRTMPLAIYLERESDTPTALALAVVLIGLSFLVVGATTVRWDRLVAARRADGAAGPPAPGAPEPDPDPVGPMDHPESQRGPAAAGRGRDLEVSFSNQERGIAIDLTVAAGCTTALIGPNGSGKSTVCAVVAGLLDAAGGSVRLGGRVLDGPGAFVPAGRRDVALLAQSPGVFTHMSVLENVAFGPRCQGLGRARARRRARAELEAVGAGHLAERPGSELSGGQAARVALARALATGPAVLVLDEPMAALDVGARQEVRALIARRAHDRGLTVVLVTHNVLDVAALADDVVVLEHGRVVERGPAARVLTAPATDFTARLTGTTVLSGRLAGSRQAPALELAPGMLLHGRPQDEEQAEGTEETKPGGPGVALVPPDAVALYHRPPTGSPRNVLAVKVRGVERAGALVGVELALGEQSLRATITAAAVAELGVRAGQELWAVVKAVEVRILGRPVHQDIGMSEHPGGDHDQD